VFLPIVTPTTTVYTMRYSKTSSASLSVWRKGMNHLRYVVLLIVSLTTVNQRKHPQFAHLPIVIPTTTVYTMIYSKISSASLRVWRKGINRLRYVSLLIVILMTVNQGRHLQFVYRRIVIPIHHPAITTITITTMAMTTTTIMITTMTTITIITTITMAIITATTIMMTTMTITTTQKKGTSSKEISHYLVSHLIVIHPLLS
jgi:hypothetical protein